MSTGDPAAGHWTTTQADSAQFLNAISCPSTAFCVAVDNEGDEIIGTPPRSAAGGD